MTAPLIGISVRTVISSSSQARYLAVRPTYPHAVDLAGGIPILIPMHIEVDALRSLFDRLDGLVLTGGGDIDPAQYGAECSLYTADIDAERDRVELQLARWAVEANKPLLTICRGTQVLNVALGGTLIQDIRDEVPNTLRHDPPDDSWFPRLTHDVDVVGGSKLHSALGQTKLAVNSLHHQALGKIADALEVVACAPDGIVEGIEHPDCHFIVGVQWHPEVLVDDHPPMLNLFKSLIEAASSR
jgi:putative glutamine amidotransferase